MLLHANCPRERFRLIRIELSLFQLFKHTRIWWRKRNTSMESWYSYNESNNCLVVEKKSKSIEIFWTTHIFTNPKASCFMNLILIEPIQSCHINIPVEWKFFFCCLYFVNRFNSTQTESTFILSISRCQYWYMCYKITRRASIYVLLPLRPSICMYINIIHTHNNMNLYINLIARCMSVTTDTECRLQRL